MKAMSFLGSLRWLRRTAVMAIVVTLVALISGAGPALADDNDGTIKVDGTPIDSLAENTPHDSCQVMVEFRGFDADDTRGFVTFALQPPTGSEVLLTDSFPLVAAGQGATNLGGSKTYTLTFPASAKPQVNQGFHVQLTANGEHNTPGRGKQKVFWVQPCDDPTPIPVGTLGFVGLAAVMGLALLVAQGRGAHLERAR